jgi:hypothetical protein
VLTLNLLSFIKLWRYDPRCAADGFASRAVLRTSTGGNERAWLSQSSIRHRFASTNLRAWFEQLADVPPEEDEDSLPRSKSGLFLIAVHWR